MDPNRAYGPHGEVGACLYGPQNPDGSCPGPAFIQTPTGQLVGAAIGPYGAWAILLVLYLLFRKKGR